MDQDKLSEQEELAAGTPAANLPENIPPGLRQVDPEQLAKLRERVRKFVSPGKTTVSGSEEPDAGKPSDVKQNSVLTGKDVDWSEYDLSYDVRHLYPQAVFRETPQGPKWIVMVDEFYSTQRDWRNHGRKVHVPGSYDEDDVEPLNLGEYLNDRLNCPDGWKLVSLLPLGMGQVGVLLQRTVPVALPDPKPLEKKTEVAPPTDPELEQIENAAIEFAGKLNLTPEPPVGENVGEPVAVASLEQQALAINPPTEWDPVVDGERRDPDSCAPAAQEAGEVAAVLLAGPDTDYSVSGLDDQLSDD